MKSLLFAVFAVATCVLFRVEESKAQGGALGLDILKNLGSDDDKGFEVIDAGALIASRSKGPRGSAGRRGIPGGPPRPVSVDLCYLVDVTGSMAPHIRAVKDSIRDTVNHLRASGAISTLRLCFVGYRDFRDARQLETLPFTTDVNRFLSFVERLRATGGADFPEDVFGGMEELGRQDWRAQKRIILHMADAPCHGTGCGGGTSDPSGRNADNVFRPIRAEKLKYNFGRITTRTDQMLKLFSEAYGFKIPVFDVKPIPAPAPGFGPRGGKGLKGAPGAPGPVGLPGVGGLSGGSAGLKKKVGEASIAAVLLGLD